MGTREKLVGISDEAWAAAAAKRSKGLVHLLGIEEREAGDTSIKGRLTIIAKLKAAKRAEIGRGQTGSWLYDVNRHLSICACLRKEYGRSRTYSTATNPRQAIGCAPIIPIQR